MPNTPNPLLADLRNLPAEVLERLTAYRPDTAARSVAGLQAVQRNQILEARRFARPIEQRAEIVAGVNPEFVGYATVWAAPYEVAGGPPYGWWETIEPGAATKTLAEKDPVKFFLDHDGLPLASTAGSTLTLAEDDTGLLAAAAFDSRSTTGMDVAFALERGDLDAMSLAFRVIRQEWSPDYTERRILEMKLFDVSVVSFPANPATVAQLRTAPPTMSVAYARALVARDRLAG